MTENSRFRYNGNRVRRLVWRLVFVAAATALFQARSWEARTKDGAAELARLKAATGGAAWDTVSRISATGEKTSFGLRGTYRSVEDLTHGFFEVKCDYKIFVNEEGFDSAGRWRQDNSGQIHPLDSMEAKEVAVTEAYLAARGYLFPERVPAAISSLGSSREGAAIYLRIIATPTHGRVVTLWINASTHLLDRAVLQLSIGEKVIRYADYRRVGSLILPFSISVEHRDENETGVAVVQSYDVAAPSNQPEIVRPAPVLADFVMANNADEVRVPGYLDGASGFFIVFAKINGRGPFPFILDSGGHDILTPFAVRELGLESFGKGFSTGAGAGSTPTEFTRVNSVAIGAATIASQPFTILHIDLGAARDPAGKSQPIAGILGLELFERFVVTVDYQHGILLLRLPAGTPAKARSGIPMRFTSDMPVVEASLDGNAGWFNVDTGNNTDLIVFRTWAASNPMASLSKGPQMHGSSVGGAIDMRRGQARTFEIGDQKLTDLTVLLAADMEGSLSAKWEAGNIGNSVLRHFKVTFDYRSELIYLE